MCVRAYVCVLNEEDASASEGARWVGAERQRGQENCACAHTSRRQATRPDATSSGIDALRRPVTIKKCDRGDQWLSNNLQ